MPQPAVKQLKLSKKKHQELRFLIEQQYWTDSIDLRNRNRLFERWYKLSRNAMEVNGFPQEEKSNFSVPMILWQILAKLSKEIDALLGEESEISVRAIGKSDLERVDKIRRWMNWRIKVSLKLFKPIYDYLMQKYRYGTVIAMIGWETKTRLVKKQEPVFEQVPGPPGPNGLATLVQKQVGFKPVEKEIIEKDGPFVKIENIEDWVFPANKEDIINGDHFIRIVRLTMDDMVDLKNQGKIDESVLTEKFKKELANLSDAVSGNEEIHGKPIRDAKQQQEGLPAIPLSPRGDVRVYNWFGRFRIDDKDEKTSEVVAFYQPDTKVLLGVARLVDMFPDGRRPFVCSKMISDPNRALGIGICEMLEPIQRELDAFSNLARDAGEGAIGPVIFYEPASGFDPKAQKMEAYQAIPVADASGVKAVNLGDINLQPYVLLKQDDLSFAEKLTGITDAQLGRTGDAPNQPRTFGQTALLQAESNVRLLLDIRLERESLRELLDRIWELDKNYLDEDIFFRVTEEPGGDVLTKEDMQGSYDFDLGPVTSISNRQVEDQKLSQALALAGQLGQPQIAIALMKKILERLNQNDIAAMLPNIKEMAPAKNPEDENVLIYQGQDVDPHPMDNHIKHIASHTDFLTRMSNPTKISGLQLEVSEADKNPGLLGRIQSHIDEHKQAEAGKQNFGQFSPGAGLQQGQPANLGAEALQQTQQESGFAQQSGDGQSALSGALNSSGVNFGG